MELFISIIILLDSDAVTELIYELFWRYLDSNLEETILMVQLSTIQKVIDARFVHFLVCQRIIRFEFVQCLSGAGQIEPFPTNAARRFYKTNQANQHAALLHSTQVQSDSWRERGLLEVVNVSSSVQTHRIDSSLRNLEYDRTLLARSKSCVWHASGRLWVRAIEICADSKSVQRVQNRGDFPDFAIQVCVLSDTQRDWKAMEWCVGRCGAFFASASLRPALSRWIRFPRFYLVQLRQRGSKAAWIRSVARSFWIVCFSVDKSALRGHFDHEETERWSAFVSPRRGSQSCHTQSGELSHWGLFGVVVPRGNANLEACAREWSESLLVDGIRESDLQAAGGYVELCVQEDPIRFLPALQIEWIQWIQWIHFILLLFFEYWIHITYFGSSYSIHSI